MVIVSENHGTVQGTSADITKRAFGQLPNDLTGIGARIIGTVHDEIIIETPDQTASYAAVILREIMIEAGEAYLARIPVEVEIAIGETWARKGKTRSLIR